MTAPDVASRFDAAGLSRDSLEILRALLLGELATQTAQAADCRATMTELTGQMDVDSMLEREIAETSAVRANGAIADIQRSLERLDGGSYGTCEQCGGAIRFERLEAIPHARLCVACSGHGYG
jgi:RNA polymerase-binding transcription factor